MRVSVVAGAGVGIVSLFCGLVDFLCCRCTACLTFHEFSSRFPAFTSTGCGVLAPIGLNVGLTSVSFPFGHASTAFRLYDCVRPVFESGGNVRSLR